MKKSINQNTQSQQSHDTELLLVRRTTRVTKGGRRYSFQAVVSIGDKKGSIGWARARGADVSIAMEKALNKARRKIKTITLVDGTIPFEIKVKYKSTILLLQPSKSGGIIAGGAIRKICALAGIKNIKAKILSRTKNKINHIYALFKAFDLLNKVYSVKRQTN